MIKNHHYPFYNYYSDTIWMMQVVYNDVLFSMIKLRHHGPSLPTHPFKILLFGLLKAHFENLGNEM